MSRALALTLVALTADALISREARAQEPAPVAANEGEPSLAGWHEGLFYLHDREDYFRLYVQGRVHVDSLSYFGPGVRNLPADQALKSSFSLRRARLELSGELLQNKFQWSLAGEFGPTSTDNVGARNAAQDCSVDPTTGVQTCTSRAGTVEAPLQKTIITDAFINYAASPWLNIQAGQYLVPISLENRVGDNGTPFLERSMPVRLLAAPNTRDIGVMVWGEAPKTTFYYSVGIFNGDGPNRLNADSRYDGIGRVFARPLARSKHALLRDAQIGVSGRYGSRDKTYVGYDLPTLTTQGGYAFWRPTYNDSSNRFTHILPSGDQGAVALELFLPISKFDLTSELVYTRSNTREALDGYQLSGFSERLGVFKGFGYYVAGSFWVMGDRSITGFPPYGRPNHIDLKKPSSPPKQGVQLLAKVEQLNLTYQSASRSGTPDRSSPDGDISMTALSFGATYWASKHFRLSVNYVYNLFPDSTPVSPSVKGGAQQTADQRAIAPAQNLAKGSNDGARDGGHHLHELQFRLGVQF
jgi:hypothetical protein